MIAVDLDSTLYDFSTAAREAFLLLAEEREDKDTYFKGAYHPWTEWRSPADVCGRDIWMEVIARCHEDDIILKQEPFPGAVDTVTALSERYQILYISNRSTESTQATMKWLWHQGFPMGADHQVVCMMEDKAPYLDKCEYLIDDRPKTLIEFVYTELPYRERRKAFGLMYEYNRALTDIPNIYLAPTWAGLNYYMVSKGILPEPAHKALEAV